MTTKPRKPSKARPLIESFTTEPTRVASSLYASKCRRCGKWIGVFAPLLWCKGEGSMHESPAACALALPSIDLTVQEDPAAVRRDIRRVGGALERSTWTFARTQPHQPHEWTLRGQWRNQALFDAAVYRIKVSGEVIMFKKMYLRKLRFGGRIYWGMEPRSAPAACTMLINRALDGSTGPE